MMTVDLARIAELSKIYFAPGELAEMQKDMASIIALMDSLRDVELPEGESACARELPLGMLRDDAARPSMPAELITSQAPDRDDFELQRVVE